MPSADKVLAVIATSPEAQRQRERQENQLDNIIHGFYGCGSDEAIIEEPGFSGSDSGLYSPVQFHSDNGGTHDKLVQVGSGAFSQNSFTNAKKIFGYSPLTIYCLGRDHHILNDVSVHNKNIGDPAQFLQNHARFMYSKGIFIPANFVNPPALRNMKPWETKPVAIPSEKALKKLRNAMINRWTTPAKFSETLANLPSSVEELSIYIAEKNLRLEQYFNPDTVNPYKNAEQK